MKPVQMLGFLVVAATLGAVAGGAVGILSGDRDAGPDPLLMDRLDEIGRNMDALRTSANAARDDVADVRERLVAVELDLSERESRAGAVPGAAAAPSADPDAAAAAAPEASADDALRALRRGLPGHERRVIDMTSAIAGQERFVKGMKIRAMPEDERWRYAAEKLGLNSVQVDELRAAQAVLQEGLKEAVVEETTESGGGSITFRRVDGNKLREVQSAFRARVDNALNDDQKKAWKDEGFSHAMGRSRGAVWMRAPRIRARTAADGNAAGTATIEIVTTETRETGESGD